MRRASAAVVAMSMAVALAGCGREPDPRRAIEDPGPLDTASDPLAQGAGTGEAARGDQGLLTALLEANRIEVELGTLAQKRARDPQVRDFAAQVVRDHQTAIAELREVAALEKIDMTGDDPSPGTDVREDLEGRTDAEFDREYMRLMADRHERLLEEVRAAAGGAGSGQLRRWAASARPVIEKHLQQAREIQSRIGKDAGG